MVKKSKSVSVSVKVGQMIEEADARAIFAGVLLLSSVALFFIKGDVPDWLSAITGMAIGSFFKKNE